MSSSGSLVLGEVRGVPRFLLNDRALTGGDLIELCTSGGWLTGRFEWDAGRDGPPMFFFSVELDGGGVEQLSLPIPERALVRRRSP